MSNEPTEFEPTSFTAGRISANKILKDDEHRLFQAHALLAQKGHASQFPLKIQAILSAPFIVDANGETRVLTMGIDTVGMLPVLPPDSITPVVRVKVTNNDDGIRDHTVVFSRMADGSAWRSSLEYDDAMPEDHESFRADILAWAQAQFSAGVAHMAEGQMFDRMAFSRLQTAIRRGIDAIFDKIAYIPGHGRGDFIEASAPPRLLYKHYSNSRHDVVMKLQKHGDNPVESWVGILASMPAEVSFTASRLRFAVMNAVAGSERDSLDSIPWEGWEDTACKGSMMVRRDQVPFENMRASEIALFVRGIRSMSKDILEFHKEGRAEFSEEALGACHRLAKVSIGSNGEGDWEDAVSALQEALQNDEAPLADFLEHVGWELAPSPVLFMKAKMNLFTGRDLAYGLYDNVQPTETSGKRGPKR